LTIKKQKLSKVLSRKIKWMFANVEKTNQCTIAKMRSALTRIPGPTTALIVSKKLNFMLMFLFE
jgi:hypothetical protein